MRESAPPRVLATQIAPSALIIRPGSPPNGDAIDGPARGGIHPGDDIGARVADPQRPGGGDHAVWRVGERDREAGPRRSR